jgi:hypothetical protein
VSVWVQSVGGSTLSGRRKELLEMLRQPASPPAPVSDALGDAGVPSLVFVDASRVTGDNPVTLDDDVQTPAAARRRIATLVVVALVAVLSALLIGVGAALHSR